jgi:ABC-type antimicrobial peptide transport system permease subunit
VNGSTGSPWNAAPIRSGRSITAADTPSSAHVAVVNEAFVRQFFAGVEPLGVRLGVGGAGHQGDYEIVGVTEDVKYSGVTRPTRPMIFLPTMQLALYDSATERQVQARSTLMRTIELAVAPGTSTLEPAIRRALAEVHPDLVVTRVIPLPAQISGNFRTNRLLAALTSAYGLLALALASLGLYGVTAYGVSRRRHEIGVRMALGAGPGRIVWAVLRGALVQAAVGLAIGVPLAAAAGGALTSQLFEVSGRDPVVIGTSAMTLAATAILAAALPARRAASVDPTTALRAH